MLFLSSFLYVFLKNINRNLYENIVICNTFTTLPSYIKFLSLVKSMLMYRRKTVHAFLNQTFTFPTRNTYLVRLYNELWSHNFKTVNATIKSDIAQFFCFSELWSMLFSQRFTWKESRKLINWVLIKLTYFYNFLRFSLKKKLFCKVNISYTSSHVRL